MSPVELLPHLNASLNGVSTVALVAGYVAIRRGNRTLHPRLMRLAFLASSLFLVGYLTRYALAGATRFPEVGAVRGFYLALLASHTLAAAVALPMVLRTMWLGHTGRFEAHRSLARRTFPVWLYVSVTGVLVYVMLYHLAPRLV